MIVYLKGHISEEGRLCSTQVITPASVEDFAVVFDLEDEVFDHTLSHCDLTVHEQAESDEVRVPVV